MKVWLPYVQCGSGTDIFTIRLAESLRNSGINAIEQAFSHKWQYIPWRLKLIEPPQNTSHIITNTWNGFAFKREGVKLVVVQHLFVLDPAFKRYCSKLQLLFYESFIKYFEKQSGKVADQVVAVSDYAATTYSKYFNFKKPLVILNGIDTDFFSPGDHFFSAESRNQSKIKLLFVGNMNRRKGFDILPDLMNKLGDDFQMMYTSGLRTKNLYKNSKGMIPLGTLDQKQIRSAYRSADFLIFPTRLEGFGYVAAEAMACGTPVVSTISSSIPEVVMDGETGILCPVDDIDCFAKTIKKIAFDQDLYDQMKIRAIEVAKNKFSIRKWGKNWKNMLDSLN